jgi:hypothetical protein
MAVKPASPVLQTGHDLYTNLTAYWLFQDTLLDETANNHDFSISGGTVITYQRPGTDDDPVIQRTNANTNERLTLSGISVGTSGFSISCRIKVVSTDTFGTVLAQNTSYGLYTIPSGAGFKFRYFTPSGTIVNTTVLNFNQWYNVTYTFNFTGAASTFYIDGAADGTSTVTVATHTLAAALSDTGTEWCNCQIAAMALSVGRVWSSTDAGTFNTDPYGVVRDPSSVTPLGTLATGTNKTTQTTVSATTGLAVAANQVVVVCVASDNEDTADGQTSLHSGVTIDGNSATKAGEYTNSQGAANAGATTSVWYWRNTTGSSIASASTVVATHSVGKDAKAITALLFDIDSSLTLATDGIATAADDAADPSSITATGAVNDLHLWVRIIAIESDAAGTITPTAGWTAFQGTGTTGGAEASNMSVRGEWKVSTGTSSGASNPTVSAKDSASVLIGIALTVAAPPSGGGSNLLLLGAG